MEGSNTKLLQVVSLQKLFLKSIGAQISDLIKFNNSKFVHVSSLNFFGSRIIYMFQGIHRLQICSNCTYRTKVMNFMVFISHFLLFYFHPKTLYCTTMFSLHIWLLHISRISGISNLQFLSKWFILYRFYKISTESEI
jgi:hypothetical protein